MPRRRSRPWRIGVVLFASLVLVSVPVGTASATGGYAVSPSQDGGWNDADTEEPTSLGIDGRIDGTARDVVTSDTAADRDNDRFEPNDGIGSAAEITVGRYADLRIVDGEIDTFAVDRSAGDPLTTRIEFDHSVGDLDVAVYGPNGTRIDGRSSTTDNESITVDGVPETGTYYVAVYGVGNASAPYTLSVTEEGARTGIVRDHRICSNVNSSGECPSGSVTTRFDQGDFRAISLIEFADVNRSHRLTWKWYGPSGELYDVVETTTNEAGDDLPEYSHWGWIDVNGAGAALRPGEWEVVAYLDGARVFADTFAIEPARTPDNDRFEPNAGFGSAAEISPGTYDDLRIADDEYDVFAVDLSAGDPLSASIDFDHSVGDLDLSVYGPDETRLAGNVSTTDNESLAVDAVPEAGTYYVAVYGYGGDSAPYSLTVGVDSAGSGVGAYADENGVVGTEGLTRAIEDWATGEIPTDLLQAVIRAWATRQPVD